MVQAVRTTRSITSNQGQDGGGGVTIGVQGRDGTLRERFLTPGQPMDVQGVRISVDDAGKVTVRGTDRSEDFSLVDGEEYGVPGSTVVGIEGNGDPIYLSIPRQVAGLTVAGASGDDDYWAPVDNYDGASIHDTQGDNWVTNIGSKVSGKVSVADNHVAALGREKGGLELVGSGDDGGSATGTAFGSWLQSVWSWLSEKF